MVITFHKKGEEKQGEFEQEIIDIARVTRVMAGGKRMSFRASVAIGDKKGRFGFAVAKGVDVMAAVNKAVRKAKKHLSTLPLAEGTIPYPINLKFKAAKIFLKPAPPGTGIKAGGALRALLELAGVENIIGKILGSKNKINNSVATVKALQQLSRLQKQYQKVETPKEEGK